MSRTAKNSTSGENEVTSTSVVDSAKHDPPKSKTEKAKEAPVPFSNYWRIFTYSTRNDRILLAVAIASALASGVPLPLMNIVFGGLVGNFNGYFIPGSGITEKQFKQSVSKSALYIVYLFIGKFVLTYISMLSFRIASLRISASLRLAYMNSLFSQSVGKLDQVSAGTVANTITSSSNTIQLAISDKLSQLLQAVSLIIAAYAIAFRYSWALTLVTSSSILFILLVYGLIIPVAVKAQRRIEKADEKHASIAAEAFSSIRTVCSLGAEPFLSAKHSSWVEESEKRALKTAPLQGLQLAPAFFSIYSSFALSFWVGLKLFREGSIHSVNTVIIVFFSVIIVVTILGNIAGPIMMISKAVGVSAGFFEIIDSQSVSSGGLALDANSANADVEFRDVTFEYPTRPGVQVLKKFSARFERGKTTALVGPSGSGKSTIVALLERWYDLSDAPKATDRDRSTDRNLEAVKANVDISDEKSSESKGAIILGAHNLIDLKLKWWRSQIGLVQQEPFLFNDTIYNNVAFGLEGSPLETESVEVKNKLVEEACREAFADEFIQRFPQGYLTMVGESGIKLSGGQRQRLAIARSIVKRPLILILDEATSSIDVRAEGIVQKALDRVSEDRTTIVIAHRLSTIRKADKIVVLRDGVKIEEGSHAELLSNTDGLYSGLVHAQQLEKESSAQSDLPDDETENIDEITPETQPASAIEEAKDEASSFKKRGFFGTIGLFLYEQRARWAFYLVTLVAAMGGGAAFSLQSWFFAQIVEVFQFTGQKLKDAGDYWSLRYFILALAMAVCYYGLGYSTTCVAAYVASAYRREYFQNILRKPISFYDAEGNASGTLMGQLSSDPKALQELLGTLGPFPLIAVFNVCGCVIISFYYGWKLALVTFFSAMPVLFIAGFIRFRWETHFEELNSKVFAHSSQFATEAIGAFRTVSALTMEDFIVRKYSTLLRKQILDAVKKAWYAMFVYALTDSIELLAIALSFWYGGQLLASREYNVVQFFIVYVAIVQGGQAAGQFCSFAPNLANATGAGNRILNFRRRDDSKINSRLVAVPMQDTNGTGAKVELKDVSFKYPSRDIPTFNNLNVSIDNGQFVGFVGPSGCGKTTVISLLERFYDPTFGVILLNDQDIRSLEVSSYRKALSLVSQEPRLFDGTIRENLVLGLDSESVSENKIVQACKDAEIHDFIISLPEGYSTELGINTQTTLSGGQKQRLCLARALLREPRLLLLDEATSSLDSQSEKLVQTALERLAGQRSMTVIAVAHRLATIQKADIIFVFGESEVGLGARILERGSHGELLRRRGAYWQMCQAQALDR